MKKMMLAAFLLVVNAYANCPSGSFVVYSSSEESRTAKVYVRGDREAAELTLRNCEDRFNGSRVCTYSGKYYLKVTKDKQGTYYDLDGCANSDESLADANNSCGGIPAPSGSCTCYGGPGNYPYPCWTCSTCHGGPGNYPYSCWTCPGK